MSKFKLGDQVRVKEKGSLWPVGTILTINTLDEHSDGDVFINGCYDWRFELVERPSTDAYIVISLDDLSDYTKYTKEDAIVAAKGLVTETNETYVVVQALTYFKPDMKIIEAPVTLN